MAVGIERQLGRRVMVARLDVGNKTLRPACHPFKRDAQSARGPGYDDFFWIKFSLVAETASYIGRHHPDTAFRHTDLLGDLTPYVMRHMGRSIEGQLLARRIVDGDYCTRF